MCVNYIILFIWPKRLRVVDEDQNRWLMILIKGKSTARQRDANELLVVPGKRDSGQNNSPVGYLPSPGTGTATVTKSSTGDSPGQYSLLPGTPDSMDAIPDDPSADDEFAIAVAQKSLV